MTKSKFRIREIYEKARKGNPSRKDSLLFGHTRTSGLPVHEKKTGWFRMPELHDFAPRNDERVKERVRLNFNLHMKTQETRFLVGDQVLLKLHRTKKSV